MSLKKGKNFLSILQKSKSSKTDVHSSQSCSKKSKFSILLFPILPLLGLLSLIWFLIRVIPKPSRATYPCQQAAFPLASAFVVWLIGLAGSALAYRRASHLFARARYIAAVFCLVAGVMFVWMIFATDTGSIVLIKADNPIPNQPLGIGRGVNPGRVVWVHDPAAATWPGSNDDTSQPYWYTDTCTNPQIVSAMLSKSLRTLAGTNSDSEAWDAIFHNFNKQMGRGDIGYQPGQKIAIKTNGVLNLSGRNASRIENAPQLTIALLKQLIEKAGVAPEDICIGDPQNSLVDHWYNMVHDECPGVVFMVKSGSNQTGRTQFSYDHSAPFYFSDPDPSRWVGVTKQDYIPDYFAQADYFINFPVLKSHNSAGVTLAGKNHYGSLMRAPNAAGYYDEHSTRPADSDGSGEATPGMGHYRANVDLMGHPKLGGKTLLVLIDGLYGGRSWDSQPIRWEMEPFNGNWPNSIFLSQDQVAADSVAFDFLYNEWDDAVGTINGYPQYSGTEDYLHEAALAYNPPSGTIYDPAHDGGITQSLGVHEHWNNPIDKQYTRNLGIGNGIELIAASTYASENGPIHNVTRDEKYDYMQDAINAASDNDYIILSPGTYEGDIDLSGKNITISSSDPNNSAIVASTIIKGSSKAVTFANNENAGVLTGLTITGATIGISCDKTSPTISKCVIIDNEDYGIELRNNASPNISFCQILCNNGSGIGVPSGSALSMPSISNSVIAANRLYGIQVKIPTISNCTIAANGQQGVVGNMAKINNSIIFYNSSSDNIQIQGSSAKASYSDVQGGWDGTGNIDQDPCFAETGFWDANGTPEDTSDDTCLAGDYHLLSIAGRWIPSYPSESDPNVMISCWMKDEVSSPCIDAADPNASCGDELWPHGKLLNMGAYGGSTQASLSSSDSGDIRDLDNNGLITFMDASQIIGEWNSNIAPIKADLNLDVIIDTNDLAFFDGNWQDDSNNVVPQFDVVDDVNATAGVLVNFSVSATDTDGDDLEYLAAGLPDGAVFDAQELTWTPEQEGEYKITFIASDNKSLSYMTVTITVEPESGE
ncbi:MAG: DUF362 domain-containing protein [Sedimentisphaerales bacterium]|nr:DUF362 domain-containing protein [Sedimentisphaerales bacterium]